jgi:hypothetical protein
MQWTDVSDDCSRCGHALDAHDAPPLGCGVHVGLAGGECPCEAAQ